jgi:crotonobetainyl-CoA:carnitine CoA-transferase CaiB-like acyl-CoA transferase
MAQGVVTGKPAPPMTQRLSAWGVYDIFDTADKDQVFIAVVSDTQWRKFCEAFGFAELMADRGLDANSGRVQQRERTMPYLREQFGRWSKAELMAKLETIGLPFAPVARPEDLFDDPHLNAAGGLIDLTLPDGQAIKLPALPLEMHGERFDAYRDLPHVGQHSREALLEAGFSAAEIAELSQSGVIRLPEAA